MDANSNVERISRRVFKSGVVVDVVNVGRAHRGGSIVGVIGILQDCFYHPF